MEGDAGSSSVGRAEVSGSGDVLEASSQRRARLLRVAAAGDAGGEDEEEEAGCGGERGGSEDASGRGWGLGSLWVMVVAARDRASSALKGFAGYIFVGGWGRVGKGKIVAGAGGVFIERRAVLAGCAAADVSTVSAASCLPCAASFSPARRRHAAAPGTRLHRRHGWLAGWLAAQQSPGDKTV